MRGVTFEKDSNVKNRYVRFYLREHGDKLRPILEEIESVTPPEGWEDGLTSEEFFEEVKKMLRRKFDERDKIR